MLKQNIKEHLDCYCIIGLGASGIATAIEFNKHKIKYKIFESKNKPGGVWQSEKTSKFIYQELITNTSKFSRFCRICCFGV
jgi:cation diffusion facilitator CzcD-associated flavoprotein CzcO